MYRWWIAYKYICSRFITVAALLAVTLSVTVLIIVVAVMGTVVMLAGAYGARRAMLHWLTILGVGIALASIVSVRSPCPTRCDAFAAHRQLLDSIHDAAVLGNWDIGHYFASLPSCPPLLR